MRKLGDDKPSMENHGIRTSSSWLPPIAVPADQLKAAADLLNGAQRVAILAGQGALRARAEVEEVADRLGAPVAKALLGRRSFPTPPPSRRAASAISGPCRPAGHA